jgi:VanZ family protein
MQIPNWLRRWGPVMLGGLVIWTLSTGYFTDVQTGRVVIPVLHGLFPWMTHRTLILGHQVVRKLAHLCVYFVFGLLLLQAIRGKQKGWQWKWAVAAIGVAAAYAALDEFHQSFVPLRHPSVRDVCLDVFGALAAQVAVWTYERRNEKGRTAPSPKQGTGG